jgi:hypothetical protein
MKRTRRWRDGRYGAAHQRGMTLVRGITFSITSWTIMVGWSLQLATTFSAIPWLEGILFASDMMLRIESTVAIWLAGRMTR